MTAKSVVIAEQRMDPALIQVAREACARAGADCYAWRSARRIDDLAGQAALAIGVLAAGARRIPGDLAGLVTDQIPGLPLVLLSEEPLVRPVVSLHDGLVTLLEPPPSALRLAGCVRALLTDSPPPATEKAGWWQVAPGQRERGIARHEYRVGSSWVGVLEGEGSPLQAASAPAAWLRTAGGVSAIITAARGGPSPDAGDLGGAAAVIQLESSGDRLDWMFLAPRAGAALGLYSTQRLPAFTDLGRRGEPGEIGSRRLAAAPGDIAVALVAPGDAWNDLAALGADLAEGGAAFLDRMETRLRSAPVPFSCLAIEVR